MMEYQVFNKLGKKIGILKGVICEFREEIVVLTNKRLIQLVDFMAIGSSISVTTYVEVFSRNKVVAK